ncbi:M23 family metallopeptidase [Paenibacillus xylaniclasticus]|uniref:M23 family metallopeptidase n=1 Tax=Paenibacillus xylaniclasticus TaxID=588083 RepID=UPI0013DFEFF1|nr:MULTISPECIES: M23 family metallopeptidase [Paenibacillus]GFN32528.1 hypothetical protein PCURB6_27880 [Paenibacillus curdlanolyticus]
MSKFVTIKILVSPLGTVTTRYGAIDGTHSHLHKGIDFACSDGTEIHSPVNGVVSKITHDNGLHEGLGNAVMIKTGDGFRLIFGHLSALKTNVGDIIEKGDVIGLCGCSGRSFGTHLHLSIRDKLGHYIDPELWFNFKHTVSDTLM